MDDICVGCLVKFLEDFESDGIPSVGIVVGIMPTNYCIIEEFDLGIKWYSVLFGKTEVVVSSEMIILLN